MPQQVIGTVESVAGSGSGFRLRGIEGWFNLGRHLEQGSLGASELEPGMEVVVGYHETDAGKRFVRKGALHRNGHGLAASARPAEPGLGKPWADAPLPPRADAKVTERASIEAQVALDKAIQATAHAGLLATCSTVDDIATLVAELAGRLYRTIQTLKAS